MKDYNHDGDKHDVEACCGIEDSDWEKYNMAMESCKGPFLLGNRSVAVEFVEKACQRSPELLRIIVLGHLGYAMNEYINMKVNEMENKSK